MSILGVEGFSALPKHCLMLCYIFFAAAVFVNGLKDLVGPNWARFIPLPMAMAISFHIGGYFTISMCVGLYNFIKVLGRTVVGLYKQFKDRDAFPVNDRYVIIAIVSIVTSLASTYDKIAIFTIGASERLAPLWAVSFLLASSGCSTKPFLTLVKPGQHIPHLTRLVYRNMSILGVEGFSALPKHCLMLCYIFFAAAVFLNGLKDLVGPNWARFTPLRMAMAISFHIGGYFTIYMCVGSLILFIWRKLNGLKADAYSSAVASGLICGEGIWTLPSSVVALAGVKPPICMKFLSGGTNVKVDSFSTPS
ncbi:BnaA06g20330D [Brassica napus]|uniref:(rape) hypothetical protein n=1 Tax=Brassica napus TaxID=3708 RepID=A0A078GYV2_BRANA|nr:unnamed protein product [Brassica napus]CDY31630.1 BnaA06g20330D [Brassica napus]